MASDVQVWHASPWLIALVDGTLYGSNFFDSEAAKVAAEKLQNGDSPKNIFGRMRTELKWSSVRSVAWVPDKNTILVRRGWWLDPWRVQTPDAETLFQDLAKLIPNPQEYETQVAPNDLTLDPRVGIGAVIAIVGLMALIGGAVEGAGQAPVRGRFIAVIGEEIGVIPAIAIGIVTCLAGLGSLVLWYFKRPHKHVVRRTA